MIAISCPKCGKEYIFDESKIPRDVEMLECKICKTRFLLDWDEDLFVDPLEDLPAAEERWSIEFASSSEPDIERREEAVEHLEAGRWAPLDESESARVELDEFDATLEKALEPDAETAAQTRYWRSRQAPLPTFAAERFRMLSVKNKKRESKLFLYGLLALGIFLAVYFLLYSGR